MDRSLIDVLINYGALGAITIFMGTFIKGMRKEHAKERDSWQQTSKEQFCKMSDVIDSNTSAMTKLESAITSLEKRIN
jgi:DNA-binding transcriptional regulator GbsR (MarR family)